MSTNAFNLMDEFKKQRKLKPRKKRKKQYVSTSMFTELDINRIPFDNVDVIYQEPGMYIDPSTQADIDKLMNS